MSTLKIGFCPIQEKMKFLNRREAEKHLERKGYIGRAYYCKECDHFHTTSKKKGSFEPLKKTVIRRKRKPRRLI